MAIFHSYGSHYQRVYNLLKRRVISLVCASFGLQLYFQKSHLTPQSLTFSGNHLLEYKLNVFSFQFPYYTSFRISNMFEPKRVPEVLVDPHGFNDFDPAPGAPSSRSPGWVSTANAPAASATGSVPAETAPCRGSTCRHRGGETWVEPCSKACVSGI